MKKLNTLMLAAAVTTALVGFTVAANATTAPEMEKCYGIAKTGKNDCAGNGAATCAGSATKDGQGFITLSKGLCERIVGGSLTATATN